MSSPFLCVGGIIAKFTAVGMKSSGGGMLGIDPMVVARALWVEGHSIGAVSTVSTRGTN